MPTSVFFNNFTASGEQRLVEDLIVESIRIYGQEMYYVSRSNVAVDGVTNEDPYREYESALLVEFYIKNVEGFGGAGDFLSKFNLEIQDNMTLVIARRAFADEISIVHQEITRPREGDLIYFPLNGKLFEIKFVEHEAIFYQFGALQTYELRCELFVYSNEVFRTGIPAIDNMMKYYSLDEAAVGILTENQFILMTESGAPIVREEFDLDQRDPAADNDEIEESADDILVWDETDPFAEGTF